MPLVNPTLIAIPPSPDMDNHDPHASMMDDSASSEGVSTPGEDYDRTLGAPLSINIPKQFHYPPIGTPFVTSSSSLYEYPFPTVPSRPPLSTASSSSSITSTPGPPSAAVMDKHLPKLFARLTSRSPTHRRAASATGLPVIPIPPRLRKLSGGHMPQPGRSDLSVPRARSPKSADSLSHGLTHEAGGFALRKTGADRTPDWTMSPRQLGPALSSPPRSCIDTQFNIPPFLVDPDDEIRSYLGEPTRGVEITRLDGF